MSIADLLPFTNEMSLIERTNQYLMDRIEGFDDYYPCMRKGCDLAHLKNWLNLFVSIRYSRRRHIIRFRDLATFLAGGYAA